MMGLEILGQIKAVKDHLPVEAGVTSDVERGQNHCTLGREHACGLRWQPTNTCNDHCEVTQDCRSPISPVSRQQALRTTVSSPEQGHGQLEMLRFIHAATWPSAIHTVIRPRSDDFRPLHTALTTGITYRRCQFQSLSLITSAISSKFRSHSFDDTKFSPDSRKLIPPDAREVSARSRLFPPCVVDPFRGKRCGKR